MTAARIEDFAGVLRFLRGLGRPCEPPVGVGSFLLLYASDREVVVWYSPAREQHREGEVAIPCALVAAAWQALTSGHILDEPALEAYGQGPAAGRWLLALLAQIPGVAVRANPLALAWEPEEAAVEDAAIAAEAEAEPSVATPAKRRRKRARAAAHVETT